jgi:hypothetical protein
VGTVKPEARRVVVEIGADRRLRERLGRHQICAHQ